MLNRYGMTFQTTVATTIARMTAPSNRKPCFSPVNARQTMRVPSTPASILVFMTAHRVGRMNGGTVRDASAVQSGTPRAALSKPHQRCSGMICARSAVCGLPVVREIDLEPEARVSVPAGRLWLAPCHSCAAKPRRQSKHRCDSASSRLPLKDENVPTW